MKGYKLRKLIVLLRQEEGSVESTLVLIPLLVLFLVAVQIIVAINYRNLDLSYAQSSASSSALSSSFSTSDEIVTFEDRSSSQRLDVLISHQVRAIPNLIPRLPFFHIDRTRQSNVEAIAVVEELR